MNHTDYKVYTGIEDKRKAYVAIPAEILPDEALKVANKHYKESLSNHRLKIEAGYTIGKDLYVGYSDDRKSKPVWVVTRK